MKRISTAIAASSGGNEQQVTAFTFSIENISLRAFWKIATIAVTLFALHVTIVRNHDVALSANFALQIVIEIGINTRFAPIQKTIQGIRATQTLQVYIQKWIETLIATAKTTNKQ